MSVITTIMGGRVINIMKEVTTSQIHIILYKKKNKEFSYQSPS